MTAAEAGPRLKKFLSLVPVDSFEELYSKDINEETYFGFPLEPIVRAEEALLSKDTRSIGYFSMEYGLSSNTYNAFQSNRPTSDANRSGSHNVFSNLRAIDYYLTLRTNHRLDLPIYSGGLGVLAGDTLKSSADRGVSLAAMGILWHKGYFKQNFWFKDGQIPEETIWDPSTYPGLIPLTLQVEVPLKKETIYLKLWKYYVYSFDKKQVVPLVLLDSNLEQNADFAKKLTGQLYRSDNAQWQLLQRSLLGLGGVKAFDKLNYAISVYHMNEGHAALAFVEKAKKVSHTDLEALKDQFAYTCHTPVAAGHDRFQKKLVRETLLDEEYNLLVRFGEDPDQKDLINLTEHAMNTSRHVNAVAQKHGEVTRLQFPDHKHKIQSITNGIHTHTWASKAVAELLDKYRDAIGDWRRDPKHLKNVLSLKDNRDFRQDLWNAHQENKKAFCKLLHNWKLEPDILTLCWARRIAAYKRPSLILQDIARLLEIAKRHGPIQIVMAGKAHPKDNLGFTHVNDMLTAIDSLENHRDCLRVLMLENYDTFFGKLLSNSVDIWLNNPLPPFEASGTSGMKAILNGVLQLSTLDGWVVEAADKNIGWIFGWRHEGQEIGSERNLRLLEDSSLLYETLEKIVPLYYKTNDKGSAHIDSEWITMMINAISEAAFFSTDRMVAEYQKNIWSMAPAAARN